MEISDRENYLLLKEVANGDDDAFEYLVTMGKVFRVWDDLYDQDRPVTPEVADEVFSSLSFDLSRNQFFVRYRQALEGFIFVAWNAWKDSDAWRGDKNKMKGLCAWFIRDWVNEIDVLVAWLVGGVDHARKMSLKCREFYLNRLISRGLDGYLKGD